MNRKSIRYKFNAAKKASTRELVPEIAGRVILIDINLFEIKKASGLSAYLLFLYSLGVMPVWCLKYFPKNDWLGKLR